MGYQQRRKTSARCLTTTKMERRPFLLVFVTYVVSGVVLMGTCSADGDERPYLRVTSIIVSPYLQEREQVLEVNETIPGNDTERYEGFVVDLLNNLSSIAGFDYEIQLVKDNSYGSLRNGNWTGMIGELIRGEADMVAAPLAVTWEREYQVDFTNPFHTDWIAGVIQRPPKGAAYTIPTIDELPRQSFMTYGTTKNSWIREAFETSDRDPYKSMWEKIKASVPVPLAKNNNQGVQWVIKDYSFAFFMEETTANYLTHRKPCQFVKIKTDLARREYAIAVPSGSIWRDRINRAMEQLEKEQTLQTLKDKWFINECSDATVNVTNFVFILLLSFISLQF